MAVVLVIVMVSNGHVTATLCQCLCYFMLGSDVKTNRSRIWLNCGPVSSAKPLDTSCPEYLVRYLLTSFIHVLRGVLFRSFLKIVFV